ncbi:MAG TPA: long-chain-fatty-acid--CoA ligase, partial [Rhodobacteraceae bacterium]|nr:long-chain-fatty-acid--CoA ligase [Paracoccaceae bacterium]
MTRPWEKFYSEAAKDFDLADMPSHTLVDLINKAGAKFTNRPALTTILPNGATGTVSYSELLQHANHFAAYLRDVVKLSAGDTVAVMTPNCIDFAIACMGVAKAGCVATNVNPLYTVPELEHQLTDSKAKVLVIIDLFGDKVDAV